MKTNLTCHEAAYRLLPLLRASGRLSDAERDALDALVTDAFREHEKCPEPGCALGPDHLVKTGFKHRDQFGFHWWPGGVDNVAEVTP